MKMDEVIPILPLNLDAALNEFYTAQQPNPAFAVHLEAQLRQRQIELVSSRQQSRFSFSDTSRSFMRTLRTRPVLALLLAILILLALTGMVYALGQLSGYIPGFGFTSEGGSLFVLGKPVERSVGGITLHVNQAVNDGDRFWVELTADGLSEREGFSSAFLLLSDGTKIQSTIGGSSNPVDGGTSLSYLFPPANRRN
jgi:hypothetical protein